MVLTIHVVRQGGHHYYVHDLVPGRAEGGRVAGEEPGAWAGAGPHPSDCPARSTRSSFAEVLEGRDPTSGRALRASRGDRSVAGYDLTFCAPKSVSLLHLLAPREIAEAAGTGHHRAVADALDYLGREGVGVRRSRHGVVAFLPTTGPVAGAVPPPHQSCPRSPPPHPCGGGQRGPGGRRGLVQCRQSSAARPPRRRPVALPRPPALRAGRPDGGGMEAPAFGPGRRRRGRPAVCAGSSPSGRPPWTSTVTARGTWAVPADRPQPCSTPTDRTRTATSPSMR